MGSSLSSARSDAFGRALILDSSRFPALAGRVPSAFSALLTSAAEAIASLTPLEGEFERACRAVAETFARGGKMLACGNGGSAADSAHLTAEFTGRFIRDRRPYPAICLSAETSLLTAVANDYGYDEVFARQVRAFGQRGDVFLGFTTSGNSPNVLQALGVAKELGVTTIAFLGRDGGKARGLADIELLVPHALTARIQEAHKVLLHGLCEEVEKLLGH
ncbi:MAG: SIS domain-containing protein [Verrucomicrobia bacterium]|nr:SIS domain-containing protein [Verrucomicrobiota bacterium]